MSDCERGNDRQGAPWRRFVSLVFLWALGVLGGCSSGAVAPQGASKLPATATATPVERSAALREERFSVYFPPDSWALPAAAERRLRAKCEELRAYLAAADKDAREIGVYFVSGHVDDRESGGVGLARNRRKAVEQVLSGCAKAANQHSSYLAWMAGLGAEAPDEQDEVNTQQPVDVEDAEKQWNVERKRERQVGAERPGRLCDWRKENDPRDEGRGRWRRVRLFWTSVEGPHAPKRWSLVPTPRLSFGPDSDEVGPGVRKALDGESGTCRVLQKQLRNWRRGLLVVGYASHSEVDANGLAGRRAEAVLRPLRSECGLDAGQLFPVAARPVVDTGTAARRRRVDVAILVGTEGLVCAWPVNTMIDFGNWTRELFFEPGSFEVDAKYNPLLTEACQMLKGHDSVVEIRGSAASVEKDSKHLSQSRADAVKKWLGGCGVDPSHVRTKGQGTTQSLPGARLEILP